MSQRSKRSICGVGVFVRIVTALTLMAMIVLPRASSATPPTPLNVLFVANGWCSQEDDIENHFLDLGYNVTLIKDYKVKGTTSFAAYDLIVLTESAPLVSAAGLNAIKASGKPVLVVESWNFLYAYRLGLTTSPLARLSYGDTISRQCAKGTTRSRAAWGSTRSSTSRRRWPSASTRSA
jgi:hypothetical protein